MTKPREYDEPIEVMESHLKRLLEKAELHDALLTRCSRMCLTITRLERQVTRLKAQLESKHDLGN